MSEKLLYVILQDAASGYGDAAKGQRLAFAEAVQSIVRTRVLGSPASPSQWDFPRNQEKTSVEKKNITNTTARKCMVRIAEIVDVAFGEACDEEQNNEETRQHNDLRG